MARYSEAHNRANQKYQATHYDRLAIRVKKGYKDVFKELADKKGKSLAGLITDFLIAECEKEGITLDESGAKVTNLAEANNDARIKRIEKLKNGLYSIELSEGYVFEDDSTSIELDNIQEVLETVNNGIYEA